MKFVHAADIHLDSPLRGLERYEGAPVDEIRGATRRAVENLVELCLAEEADLLVIAGDLYDGEWKDFNTGLFFLGQVARLTRAGVRVVWLRGNHDAASQITRNLRPPEGAFELASRKPETRVFEDLGVAVHGQSYAKRDVTNDLAARYPEPRPGLFNLGVLHTALEGRAGHDTYAPCSVDGLVQLGYDYWALGHVHEREVVHEKPWIVFPGNLQGRHIKETGAKGASVVRVEAGEVVSVEHRPLDVVRWLDCAVDLGEAESGEEAVERVRACLENAADEVGDRLLAARVHLQGDSEADASLRSDRDRWSNEIRLAAMNAGAPIWVEKIRFETRPPRDPATLLQQNDPIAELARAARAAAGDPERVADVAASLKGLAAKLPAEYRRLPEALDFEDPAALAELLRGAEEDLLPRLLGIGDPA